MDGPPLYREAVTFRSPGSLRFSATAPWVAIRHPIKIRRRRFTRRDGGVIVIAASCKTPSGYPCVLSSVTGRLPRNASSPGLCGVTPSAYGLVLLFVSQGGAAAPPMGCGVQPLRGEDMCSPCEAWPRSRRAGVLPVASVDARTPYLDVLRFLVRQSAVQTDLRSEARERIPEMSASPFASGTDCRHNGRYPLALVPGSKP